jgi:hypothetical protein
MTTIELKDFLNFSFLSDVKLSANAKNTAYLQHKCNIEKDNYDTKLYVNDLNGKNTVLDFKENINIYCWDKSDDLLLFGVYSNKSTIFFRLDIRTMNAIQAFTIDNIIKSIECIDKNKYLLSARVNITNLNLDDDCIIVDELPIQANGVGYVSGTRNTLFIYDEKQPIKEKIAAIAQKIYGAEGVSYTAAADKTIAELTALGFDKTPICIAKTQYSLSDDMSKLGRPSGFTVNVREVRVAAGAGFLVAITGAIMTMPGLPKHPAAERMDIDNNGKIVGLF